DNVDAENLAVLLVGDHFDEALVMTQNGRAAIAREGEAADLHLVPLLARLRFRQTDAADAWLRISRAGNAHAIDRHGRLARDVRHCDHAFARGHVSELRRAGDHVADRVNARLVGLLLRVDLDESAVQLDLGVLQADIIGVRLAAYRDQ